MEPAVNDTVLIGARPPVHDRAFGWALGFVRRVGHLWAENPWTLITFQVRLVRAWRCFLFDLAPRQLAPTLWRFVSQTARTFLRGVFVVLGLGLAIGFGTGAVAAAIGPLLQPTFASVILVALLRDGAPLALTLFMAGRMGGSIAARLATGTGAAPGAAVRVSDCDLTGQVLPFLVAATITGALFYSLGAWCIVTGYLSLGDPGRFLSADPWWFLALPATRAALGFGVLKSALSGSVVAFVASAYGVAARERALRGVPRSEDVQDAVWETSVTAILLATLVSVALWLSLEGGVR